MTKRGIFITSGISVLSIVGIYIAVNRSRKNKMIAEINEIIDKGSQESGDVSDLAKSEAFDPNFFKKYFPNSKPGPTALAYAKKINAAIGPFSDNEEEIVKIFSQMKSKSIVSFTAAAFKKEYGKDLGNFIVEKVDKDNNLEQIQTHIKSIPNK